LRQSARSLLQSLQQLAPIAFKSRVRVESFTIQIAQALQPILIATEMQIDRALAPHHAPFNTHRTKRNDTGVHALQTRVRQLDSRQLRMRQNCNGLGMIRGLVEYFRFRESIF
jgi:hypothetical protein